MANLTITVDHQTLKRARIRAIERGESVNQFLAEQLRRYATADDQATRQHEAALRFVELSRELGGNSEGARWTREELYDDRLGTATR